MAIPDYQTVRLPLLRFLADGHEHNSLRIEAPPGSAVKAAAAGRVVFAGPLVGHANVVVVEHANGLQSVYALLSDASVRAEQEIEAGAAVGTAAPLPGGKSSRVLFQVRSGGKLLPASELLGARDPADCIR